MGRVPGVTLWNKFGYNQNISIGTETVWSPGGTFSRMTAADTLNLVSLDAADDLGSTGLEIIRIWGVGAGWVEQTEDVVMNGTTPVTTSNTWLGVNRMAGTSFGSGGANAGRIRATVTTGGSLQAEMPAGEGTTQQCLFFVPAGKTALMDWLELNAIKTSAGADPELVFEINVYSDVFGGSFEVLRHRMDIALTNDKEFNPPSPFVVGEKSAITLRCTTDQNNTEVNGRFSLLLETN